MIPEFIISLFIISIPLSTKEPTLCILYCPVWCWSWISSGLLLRGQTCWCRCSSKRANTNTWFKCGGSKPATPKECLVLSWILVNLLSKNIFSMGFQWLDNFQQMAFKPKNALIQWQELDFFIFFFIFYPYIISLLLKAILLFIMHFHASVMVFILPWTTSIPTTIYLFWME